jgi:glycosyltransferase involved in cell wall biosynthesis
MKIGCFFDDYRPLHEMKDPGQIILGFWDLGIQAEMLTEPKPELESYQASFPIKFVIRKQACDVRHWHTVSYDVIIVYSWLSRHYLPVISAMKEAGSIVLAKGDTDGRKGFPVISRDFYYKGNNIWGKMYKTAIKRSPAFVRDLILRLYGRRQVAYLIEHIHLTDKVIVESPQAWANLAYICLYWKKPELIKKISIVPNPVANDIIDSLILTKQKQIVAIGRWDEVWPKNTITMAKVVCRLLMIRPDYEVVIIGSGKDIVQKLISKRLLQKSDRLCLLGPVPHNEVVDYLKRAQILFIPSNWEGFSIAAAEAVCMGCTIVGTPLESLHFLTQGGFSGTLASDFTEDALLGALLVDITKWESGIYDPQEISLFWRSRLHRRKIAERLLRLVE